MIYAVIDTNVFVSAYITHHSDSATSLIVNSLLNGEIKSLYNDEIMAEYNEVLSRKHLHISEEKRDTLFNYIRQNGILTDRTAVDKLFIDEDDRVFYEVALSKEDSFLVTGNLKHFPREPRIVTPAEMIEILQSEEAKK